MSRHSRSRAYQAGRSATDVALLGAVVLTAPIWIPIKGIKVGAEFVADAIDGVCDDIDHRRSMRRWSQARKRA